MRNHRQHQAGNAQRILDYW